MSGEAARRRVHRWRDHFDAVAVGSGTALADDPHLGTRGVRGGRDARAVVFDRRGRLPLSAQVVRPGSVLVTAPETAADLYAARGMTVVRAEGLPAALTALGRLGLGTALLEGGPTLAGAFLEADLIDEVRFFVAPKLLGAGLTPLSAPLRPLAEALTLRDVRTERVGDDVLVQGFVHDVPRPLEQGGI